MVVSPCGPRNRPGFNLRGRFIRAPSASAWEFTRLSSIRVNPQALALRAPLKRLDKPVDTEVRIRRRQQRETELTLYPLILFAGAAISAFLVLHQLAVIKEDGDQLLSAYRNLLATARRRQHPPRDSHAGEAANATTRPGT